MVENERKDKQGKERKGKFQGKQRRLKDEPRGKERKVREWQEKVGEGRENEAKGNKEGGEERRGN